MTAPALPLNPAVTARWGLAYDPEAGLLHVAPVLVAGERSAVLAPFRAGRTILRLELRLRPGSVALRLQVTFGPPIQVHASLPSAGETAVVVDGVPLSGIVARFEARGRHEVVWLGIPVESTETPNVSRER